MNNSIKIYNQLHDDKLYHILKKFQSINHIKGSYLDFYHTPFVLLKKDKPVLMLHKEIINEMIKMIKCQLKNIHLSKHIIDIMNNQIDSIINDGNYWQRFGLNINDTNEIINIYKEFKQFLDMYENRIVRENNVVGLGSTNEGEKLYQIALYSHTLLNIDSKAMQEMGVMSMKHIINKIENLSGLNFEDAKRKYIESRKLRFTLESEVIQFVRKTLVDLYYVCKKKFKGIFLPEPLKIKVKGLPKLLTKWSSRAKVSGDTMFIDMSRINELDTDTLVRLCIHEGIPGHMTERLNNKKNKGDIPKLTCLKEGWACYVESVLLGDTMTVLFQQLLHSVRTIVDTGLNSNKCEGFTIETAKAFMKKYTILDDDAIVSEIMRYLSQPGRSCSYMIGYNIYKLSENIAKSKEIDMRVFYKEILSVSVIIPELVAHIEKLKK